MDNIIFSLDPASTTGWCCISVQGNDIKIITACTFTLKTKAFGEKMCEMKTQVRRLLSLYKPTFVICEELNYFRGGKTTRFLVGIRGIIAEAVWKYNQTDLNFTAAVSARKVIGVGGGAAKEQVAEYLKANFNNDPDVNWEDNNQTDALCLAVAFAEEIKEGRAK